MAEEMIVKHCQTNFKKFSEEKQKEEKEQASKKVREEQRKRENEEKARQEAEKLKKKVVVEEVKKKEEEVKKVVEVKEKKPEETEANASDKKEEDTGPAPLGNGGTTDKYNWTQTLEELHMYIPVDESTKAKGLKVTIDTNRLFVCFFFY